MKKKLFTFAVYTAICLKCYGQKDSLVNYLKEVVIQADRKLKAHSAGFKVLSLNDSILLRNTESFSSLLRFNSPIYLREHGAGGVSSGSFRGTSASNTALIWNGINVNSINNGQTGFNSLTVSLFDAIDIRSGGGSIEYGSGAIGGTIHLIDYLEFTELEKSKSQLVTSIGSYQTYQGLYKFKFSNPRLVVNFGASYNKSKNDYKLLGTDFKNFNGAYYNFGLNGNAAFLISKFSKIKFYSSNYSGDRFFSGELPNPKSANSKYQDFIHRNLIVYSYEKSRLVQEAKLAFLTQEYRYFADQDLSTFNLGKSKRYLVNYDASYKIPDFNGNLAYYFEYESAYGKTDQIKERNRKQLSQSLIYNQRIKKIAVFEFKVRKDFNSDYKVPYTYAFGANVEPLKHIFLRTNSSKNYRVPTYNDLFWPGSGNLDLIPETSHQFEVGLGYKNNQFSIDFGAFYIHIKDKIVWTPNGDISRPGLWVPLNLDKVNNKGSEVTVSYKDNFDKHAFQAHLNYSFVKATNAATNKQLIFVPKHNLNFSVGYTYNRFSFFYQQLYTGKIYTTESNSEDFAMPHYFVANAGIDYKLLNFKNDQLIIGFKMNNVLNESYVTQPRKPMPNRNFNMNINFKF